MAAAFESSDDLVSGINITPLVDVVLVLLVIFLITAPVLYQSAIKVQLPRAQSGEESQKSLLNFTINKEGALTWNQDSISWNTLDQRLLSIKDPTSQTAMISADQATPHGTVIQLMDALRRAGLTHFGLNVESPHHPP